MNNLLLHSGAGKVSRSDLTWVNTPQATRTWRPVAHHQVADIVVSEARNQGLTILCEEYGLNPSTTQMFGVIRFHNGDPEKTRCLGIRNSHDKSFALGLTCGFSIIVCDNLCFGGETTVTRKHTNGIDLETLIPQAMDQMMNGYDTLADKIEGLKDDFLTLNQARLLTIRAAEQKVIPSCDILPVLEEFQRPRHEEFSEPTQWSLYNAVTEICKKYKPARADKCYRGLSRMFALG